MRAKCKCKPVSAHAYTGLFNRSGYSYKTTIAISGRFIGRTLAGKWCKSSNTFPPISRKLSGCAFSAKLLQAAYNISALLRSSAERANTPAARELSSLE